MPRNKANPLRPHSAIANLYAGPGVGPSIAAVSVILSGIREVAELRGPKRPSLCTPEFCRKWATRGPVLLYVFRAPSNYASSLSADPELLKWWELGKTAR